MYYGLAFIADALGQWCEAHGVHPHYIAPGKPNLTAFIERFNKMYPAEVLAAWVFTSLAEVWEVMGDWLDSYNTERPHGSLGDVPFCTLLPRPIVA